jgi:hypothetical protein
MVIHCCTPLMSTNIPSSMPLGACAAAVWPTPASAATAARLNDLRSISDTPCFPDLFGRYRLP